MKYSSLFIEFSRISHRSLKSGSFFKDQTNVNAVTSRVFRLLSTIKTHFSCCKVNTCLMSTALICLIWQDVSVCGKDGMSTRAEKKNLNKKKSRQSAFRNVYSRLLIICSTVFNAHKLIHLFQKYANEFEIQSDVIILLCSFTIRSVVDTDCVKFNDSFAYLKLIATA